MLKTPWLLMLFAASVAAPVLGGPLDEAERLLEQGELQQAAAALETALDSPATRPGALVMMTRISNATGDYRHGVEYGEQAVEALPRSSEAHRHYAVALRNKMQKVSKFKAMFVVGTYKKTLQRAIELDPANVGARTEEIGFLIHAPGIAGGDEARAEERIRELEAIDWREARFMQAELLQEQEDTDGVIAVYREMIQRDPDDSRARQGLAFALQAAGRYRDADSHFGSLLAGEDRRRTMMAHYQLARSRILGGYEPQAAVDHLLTYIDGLEEPVRGLPSESSAYWRLGMAYEQLDRIEDARKAFQKAVALDHDNDLARDALKNLRG